MANSGQSNTPGRSDFAAAIQSTRQLSEARCCVAPESRAGFNVPVLASSFPGWNVGVGDIQLNVAADQLEQARASSRNPSRRTSSISSKERIQPLPTRSPSAPSAKPKIPPSNPSNLPTTGSASPAAIRGLTPSPIQLPHDPQLSPQKRKEPPGNRAAPSSGRIVPTEAKPSELSGCIVGAGGRSVKNKSGSI